jgi:hypothetical protein
VARGKPGRTKSCPRRPCLNTAEPFEIGGTGGLSGAMIAAERSAVIVDDGAFACTSWAAWHEYTLASLTPKAARVSKLCPIRLKPGTRVDVVEEDSGEGASRVKAAGKDWYVDAQRLSAKRPSSLVYAELAAIMSPLTGLACRSPSGGFRVQAPSQARRSRAPLSTRTTTRRRPRSR